MDVGLFLTKHSPLCRHVQNCHDRNRRGLTAHIRNEIYFLGTRRSSLKIPRQHPLRNAFFPGAFFGGHELRHRRAFRRLGCRLDSFAQLRLPPRGHPRSVALSSPRSFPSTSSRSAKPGGHDITRHSAPARADGKMVLRLSASNGDVAARLTHFGIRPTLVVV